jgi:hypothetical protein
MTQELLRNIHVSTIKVRVEYTYKYKRCLVDINLQVSYVFLVQIIQGFRLSGKINFLCSLDNLDSTVLNP